MSEDPEFDDPTDLDPEPVRTGVARVDEVVAAVEGLDDLPVEEHVAVLESAHDQLRRALDPASDDPSA